MMNSNQLSSHIWAIQTMLSKYGNCTRLQKIKNKLKIAGFHDKWVGEPILYEQMSIANGPRCLSTISNPTNTAGIMNVEGKKINCTRLVNQRSSSFE